MHLSKTTEAHSVILRTDSQREENPHENNSDIIPDERETSDLLHPYGSSRKVNSTVGKCLLLTRTRGEKCTKAAAQNTTHLDWSSVTQEYMLRERKPTQPNYLGKRWMSASLGDTIEEPEMTGNAIGMP